MKSKKIKLNSEYHCWPTWYWESGFQFFENIPPAKLPISKQLIEDLNDWQAETDRIYYDMIERQIEIDETRTDAWFGKAKDLVVRLQAELPPEYEVMLAM